MRRPLPPVYQRFHQDAAACCWTRLIGISLGIVFTAMVAADTAQRGNRDGDRLSHSHPIGISNGSPGIKREGVGASKESKSPNSGGEQETDEDCE